MRTRTLQGLGTFLVAGGALLATAPMAMAATGDTASAGPSNLHAVSATDTDIVLAWDGSTASGVNYDLFFDDNPTPFIVGDHTTFDVHLNRAIGMIPGSTHTFQVREDHGASSNTLTASFAPGDNTPPTTPTNLQVTSNDASGVGLAWDPSTDSSSFSYFLNGTPCGPVDEGSNTRAVVPTTDTDPVCGLVPGSTVTFTVQARDSLDNRSAQSNTVTVTVHG